MQRSHIVIGIPVLLWGGTEIQSLTLIQALQEMGYSITVCCYHEYDLSMVDAMEQTGAEVDLLGLERTANYLATFNALRKYFKKKQPDVVHIRYIAPGLVPILAARATGIQNVFITLGQLGTPYGPVPKLFMRIAAFFAKCIICTSQEIEKSWFGKSTLFQPNMKPTVGHCTVYNGIKIDAIAKSAASQKNQTKFRKKYSIPPDKKLLAVVGRLRDEKGQILALHAMQTIVAQIPNTLLLFAGDGPDAEVLKRKTEELGLNKRVCFLGRLDSTETFILYGLSDCVIIPSIYEGFGLVAVEAMAASTPIVATKVGGLKDIVGDGVTGYLTPVSQINMLALKVLEILKSEHLANNMGRMAFKRANEVFSYKTYSKNISELYSIYLKVSDPN